MLKDARVAFTGFRIIDIFGLKINHKIKVTSIFQVQLKYSFGWLDYCTTPSQYPMLIYSQLNPNEDIAMIFEIQIFSFKKMRLSMPFANGGHFVQGEMS